MCVFMNMRICIRRQVDPTSGGGHGSEVTLSIEGGGEGHVVQSSRDGVGAGVRRHAGDAVLSLVRGELAPQLIRQDIVLHQMRVIHLVINLNILKQETVFWMLYMYLVSSKDFKRCHDLISGVRVGRLARHKVNEGLECDQSQSVRIHNAHDAGKLRLSLQNREILLKNHYENNMKGCC